MKPVFLTFIYGDDIYHKFGIKLLDKFKDQGYETFVYTDKVDSYINHRVIPYIQNRFSYHHKIFAIEQLYKLGYNEIIYLDADLYILDNDFFSDLVKLNRMKGISVTRNGIPKNMNSYIVENNLEEYRELISKYNLGDLKDVESIWEDIMYFNFNSLDPEPFFEYYHELTEIKHRFDYGMGNLDKFGNQEGYTISLSAKLSKIPIQVNESLRDTIKNLRATNYTYDEELLPILSELDIIIPYRRDSEDRKKNFKTVLEYYKKHFHYSNFIVSEQGSKNTVDIEDFDYLFRKKDLPHNQSLCINDAVKTSKRKYICVVDCDVILLNYYNIYLSLREMFLGDIDYSIPYTDCFDLPNFEIREPWGEKCVGGIFIIDKEKFIQLGMNNEKFVGWGREDDERHHRLLKNGLKFKRFHGNIIHLYHPKQQNIVLSSEINLNLLNELKS